MSIDHKVGAHFMFMADIYIKEKYLEIMKYLKKFKTAAEYSAAESGLILPNVSLVTENNTVHYNPYDPYAGHDYVEIGGLKWATMNIGANSITDTGLYFQWGDVSGYTAEQVGSGEGQKYFGWEDYKYGNGTSDPGETGMTKYNSTDGKTVLDASDDAAQANWGGSWRMPTTAEYVALGTATTSAWTSSYQDSGVAGLVLTDKTDSSKVLFFPAAGLCLNGSVYSVGSYGYYWSSSVLSSNVQEAYNLYFSSKRVGWQYYDYRYDGFAVRGVAS
jgi:hypothetical protein